MVLTWRNLSVYFVTEMTVNIWTLSWLHHFDAFFQFGAMERA
jgi:hypothetical protein